MTDTNKTVVLEIKNANQKLLVISADKIWVDPNVAVDKTARDFLAALHSQIQVLIEHEVRKALLK